MNEGKPQVYKDKDYEINASNLCTEIALPATPDESFVCCLSSMNALHYDEWKDTDAVEGERTDIPDDQRESYEASEELADEFGEPEMLEGYGRRNTTTMSVAPTKSSSVILGQVSPSIEPLKSNYFVRDGAKLKSTQKNRFLEAILKERGRDEREVWDSIAQNDGSVQHLDCLTDEEKEVFKTFAEIPQMAIINQAAQRQKTHRSGTEPERLG